MIKDNKQAIWQEDHDEPLERAVVEDSFDDNDSLEERTGVYDAAFFGVSRESARSGNKEAEAAVPVAEPVNRLVNNTNQDVGEAVKYHYIVPLRFEKGDHMETLLVRNMPVSIGLLSNATFKDLEPGQKTDLGVAGARFSDNEVDLTVLNFQIDGLEQRLQVPDLLSKSKERGGLDKVDMNEGMIGSLKVTISPEEMTILTESSKHATPCFLIRGKEIYKMPRSEQHTLQSGDLVLVVTKGILESLVQQVTRKAYMKVVPALSTPTDDTALEDLPADFVEQETANQIRGLVSASFSESYVQKDGEQVLQKKLSPQRFLKALTGIYKKLQKPHSEGRIVTDAFALYQVP